MWQQMTCRTIFLASLLAAGVNITALAQTEPATPAPPDTQTPAEPPAAATSEAVGMTVQRLGELLRQLDPEITRQGATWQLQFRERPLIVIADDNAGRMRIVSPVIESDGLDQQELHRLLQANFDSALDARYAIAQGTLWSVFIHPLSSLTERQLASAIFQVYNTANTFGTIYSSGEFTFGGGDSNQELEKLQQELDQLLRPRT